MNKIVPTANIRMEIWGSFTNRFITPEEPQVKRATFTFFKQSISNLCHTVSDVI